MEDTIEGYESEAENLIEAILECWPDCNFAKSVQAQRHPATKGQFRGLLKIWDKISVRAKEEAGYSDGNWWEVR